MTDRSTRASIMTREAAGALLFLVMGLLAIFFARNYAFGTPRAMGPGFFPIALGGLIALLSLLKLVMALKPGAETTPLPPYRLKPLILIPVAVFTFAMLVRPAGLVLAISAVVLISRLAGSGFRLLETLVLCAVLAAACTAVFVWGLGITIPIWPSL